MRRSFLQTTRALCVGFAFAFSVAAAPVAMAQDSARYDTLKAGPPVGAKIPHTLKALDQNGQEQDFKALAYKKGLVILFSRSLDW